MQNKQVSRLVTSAATRIGRLCEHPRRLLPAQRMRVLIVPDKFKGTLTAAQAARAIAAGWRKVRPGDQVETLPASDGGDGFGAVMSRLLGAKSVLCQTIDAAHRRHKALWWWDAGTRTAIIETANIIGLAMLPHRKFHPFQLDTFGIGAVLLAAKRRGAKSCLIGIGGSATNDGGFGLARALGWTFFDGRGHPIERWTALETLRSLQPPGETLKLRLRVAVDVQNTLLGPNGATRVYGPQKGVKPGDFARAERCLRQLAKVSREYFRGIDYSARPGSGAAGGLGFGLAAFAAAKLEPGFELLCQNAKLDDKLKKADLVITGEGAIDASSLMGKGAGQLAGKCRQLKIPCIGLAGHVEAGGGRVLNKTFTHLYSLDSITSPEKARSQAAFWLRHLAEQAARELL